MHISKEGNECLRTLLVQGAHYILGPFGEDSDLRRWGQKLAARGDKNAKKRAVVAVARQRGMVMFGEILDLRAHEFRHTPQVGRISGPRCEAVPTAPEIFPTAICAAASRKRSMQAGGTAASVVGEWRGVRTAAQQPEGDKHSGIESR